MPSFLALHINLSRLTKWPTYLSTSLGWLLPNLPIGADWPTDIPVYVSELTWIKKTYLPTTPIDYSASLYCLRIWADSPNKIAAYHGRQTNIHQCIAIWTLSHMAVGLRFFLSLHCTECFKIPFHCPDMSEILLKGTTKLSILNFFAK